MTVLLAAQTGQFPALGGETSDGKEVLLPVMDASAFTVVGIAFGRKAQPLLEDWYEPAYLRFVAKHGLFAAGHEADIYFVPMFVGINKAAYEPSLKRFRKSASPEIVDHVLFSKADVGPLQEALDMHDKDVPYIFVLDAKGRILYSTKGAFTEGKLDAIEEVLLGG